MSQPKDHLSDLDRHLQALETKVNQLRSSLTHWQQWYFEYSALKEEVDQLPPPKHPEDPEPRRELSRICRDFESNLITKKEINEILGKTDLKSIDQIRSVLSRRIDYVEKNVETLTKQLETEENKLSAALVVAYPDGGTDEESGLPITDIIEELDDEGNVVNSRLQSGADTSSRVVEALKKAGIEDLPETDADLAKEQPPSATDSKGQEAKAGSSDSDDATGPPSPRKIPLAEKNTDSPGSRLKKKVSFAEDTKPGHDTTQKSDHGGSPLSRNARMVQELMRKARESAAMDMSTAVIPDNESAEDTALRREMLGYMSDVGPVVAELEIEEDGPDDDDDWVMADSDEDEDEVDDEDELGRSKHSVITDDYIKRMQELERRLMSRSAFAAPRAEVGSRHRIEELGPAEAPRESKTVRFAPGLDIADDDPPKSRSNAKPGKSVVSPMSDVVEKATSLDLGEDEDEEEDPPKRVSRFKKDVAKGLVTPVIHTPSLPPGPLQFRPKSHPEAPGEEPSEPAPPEGQTLASTVVERNVELTPKEPHELDDVLLYQEAAVEYNRLRNKMIQKQGGFLKEEESPIVPLDEEEGGPPRVSKFKAARLANR